MRYLAGNIDYKFSKGIFPVGTLLINTTGSFAIGLLWALSEKWEFSPQSRLFIFTGILGGYTTFSTFSLETINLLRDGEYKIAVMNILLSFSLGIILAYTGFFLGRKVANI
ncbi:MAG: hypothetical protein Fur0012_06690 [Elusimicrobiota bacterium]